MHSYIIVTGDKKSAGIKRDELIQKFSVNKYRIVRIDDDFAVKTIRMKIKLLLDNASPYEYQALIIEDIGKLTDTAQNTLLKTIEEPPQNTICVINSSFQDYILPTIISRSSVIRIPSHYKNTNDTKLIEFWTKIISNPTITTLLISANDVISNAKDKDDIMLWLDTQIIFFRNLMKKRAVTYSKGKLTGDKISKIISKFILAKKYILYNANQKLVIDNLFLTLLN